MRSSAICTESMASHGKNRKPTGLAWCVYLGMPTKAQQLKELQEDLRRCGCLGLFCQSWSVRSEEMVLELFSGVLNQFDNTMRGRPTQWTHDLWADAYGMYKTGFGLAARTDKFAGDRFGNPPDNKERYGFLDCRNRRQRRLLEFLIPIVYPEKPTWIMVTMANTIFGALSGKRSVHWGIVIGMEVGKLADKALKGKPTPINPYLFHLYRKADLLTAGEQVEYTTGLEMLRLNIRPDVSEEVDPIEERESMPKRTKKTPPDNRGKDPAAAETSEKPLSDLLVCSFEQAITSIWKARDEYDGLTAIILSLCLDFGVEEPGDLPKAIRKKLDVKARPDLEERIR